MMLRSVPRGIRALIGAAIAATILAGCAGPAVSPGATATPTAGSTRASASTPIPTPTPTFVAEKYTCQSILPPATLAVFTSKAKDGFTLQPDFVQRVKNFDANLALFDTYGGILCQWAYPGASRPVDYGFSAITAEQAKAERATLAADGYVESADNGQLVLANPDTQNFPDQYLFVDGYWIYASSRDLLDNIMLNVFST